MIHFFNQEYIQYTIILYAIYFLSISGMFLYAHSIIIMLICLESSYLSVGLQFTLHSLFLDDIIGILFAIFILVISGGDSAIGLALIILFYKATKTEDTNILEILKTPL
jgi:NADH-quinone oxidoreductase subunit K